MGSNGDTGRKLTDTRLDVKIKLSALWVTLMLLYIYVDIFSFFKPGTIDEILEGRVWEFDITQTWAVAALALMTVPALMVFLSLVLPAPANRWTNIVVGAVYILISIGNSIGETWVYLWLGSGVEVVLLALLVWHAVKWPKQGRLEQEERTGGVSAGGRLEQQAG